MVIVRGEVLRGEPKQLSWSVAGWREATSGTALCGGRQRARRAVRPVAAVLGDTGSVDDMRRCVRGGHLLLVSVSHRRGTVQALLPCKKQTKYRDACGRDVVQPTKAGRLLDLLPLRSPPMKTSRHCHARVRPLTPPRPPDTPAAARTPPLRQPARRTSAPPRPIRRRLHAAGAHVVLALRNSDEDSWRTCMFSAAQYHFKARSLIEKYFATCFRLTFSPT
jgi:hypothetical protein